ncbi:C-type lectin lectoxin-Thr1-like, partial [Trichomycterus rosablanca]|uniref:C-type lectin lectoxin-Thr1-like n=1 Tax=Trichomycterus rosablanca TaxID=2290929 RepID=UPI002F359F0B
HVLVLLSVLCAAGSYVPHNYHFVNESKKWTDAQKYCRENYVDLATISNMDEMNELINILKNKTVNQTWIGLQKKKDVKKWRWSLADETYGDLYTYWYPGQPNENSGEICVNMWNGNGMWNDDTCNTLHPFVCYDNKLILIQQNQTWREALKYCRDNHDDLASIQREKIQRWVENVVQKASTEHVWLGLRHTLGFWFWVEGEFLCYENWAPGNWTGAEDCSTEERSGAVESGGKHKWISLPESQKLNFICSI